MGSERVLRIEEFSGLVKYKVSTIRKKLHRREIAFHRVGRMIVIPESEVDRLLRDFHPRIESVALRQPENRSNGSDDHDG